MIMENETPKMLNEIDLTHLKERCKEYIEIISNADHCDDELIDPEHYIFEEAMEALYGKDIWNFINKNI